MTNQPDDPPPATSDSAADRPSGGADAQVVADRVFSDFGLDQGQMTRLGQVVSSFSGGPEYARVLRAAKKSPKEPWASVSASRRETCLKGAMTWHLSNADMERVALRTGAVLFLTGEVELGRKVLLMTAEGDWRPPKEGMALGLNIVQLCLYSAMFAVLGFQSLVTGYWLLVPVGAIVAVVGGVAVFLAERPRRKVAKEQRESAGYLRALTRIDQGTNPTGVFAPDGSLRESD